jgi:diguanylate cyclase (GGDEF)-like protein
MTAGDRKHDENLLDAMLHFPPDSTGTRIRYAGYDRIMGSISWLLIALVALNIKLLPPQSESALYLSILCILLLLYNICARYLVMRGTSSPYKTFADLMVLLCFIVAVSWFTGKVTSPFISLIYLVLMATSLTQGRRVTYFMAGLAISSYVLLGTDELSSYVARGNFINSILQLFPFMLIAHLGAMLSGEAEHARKEVERMSLTDEVTGLNNMRNFFFLTDVQEKIAARYGKRFAIAMLDADNLKSLNDAHGHFAGTDLIRHVARIIRENIRCSDITARYGGDEFVIMFTESSKEDVRTVVERILQQMRESTFEFQGHRLGSTMSAGIASFPEDGADVKTVMAKADEAMFTSKKQGKDRLTVYAVGEA